MLLSDDRGVSILILHSPLVRVRIKDRVRVVKVFSVRVRYPLLIQSRGMGGNLSGIVFATPYWLPPRVSF